MFPGLDVGVWVSSRSDSASSAALGDILDTSVKEVGFGGSDCRSNGSFDVDTSNEHSPTVGDKSGGVGFGVGGCKFMKGTAGGDSISLFPLEVQVMCVSGSRLLFRLSASSSFTPAKSGFRFRWINAGILFTCNGNWKHFAAKYQRKKQRESFATGPLM